MHTIGLHWGDYCAMAIYMVAVVLLGLKFSKHEDNSEDYLLGGRNIPWIAVGISCLMSLLSTYSLVMIPSEIYNNGLSLWVLDLLMPVMAIMAFMLFVRFYFKLNAFTPFEYLERRYDKNVRVLVASIYSYVRILYLAMVLFATSKVFEGGAGWPPWVTILVVGIIGILYTVMGGMRAVVWTDVLQFFVLIGGLGVAVIVLCMKVDHGFWGAVTYAIDHGHGAGKFADPSFYTCNPYVRLSFWLILISRVLGPMTQGASDQITIQRLLSTNSYKSAFKAMVTSSCLTVPFTLILWFIGLAIFSFYSQNPDPAVTGDTAFFKFISTQLPVPIPGLIMAAMLAAVMSTLDSGINSMSAIWLKEFHLQYIRRDIPDKEQVKISRYATFAVGTVSVVLGIAIVYSSSWLGQSVVEAATIFTAFEVIIFPAFLFAVLSRRANSSLIWIMAGLLWGIKFGMVTWYVITKRVAHSWTPGEALGLGGAISYIWILVPSVIFIVLLTIWSIKYFAQHKKVVWLLATALFPAGYTYSMILWYYYSNTTVSDKPLGLSFQWVGFPVFIVLFVVGFIALYLSPRQPARKWSGLTIWDANSAE